MSVWRLVVISLRHFWRTHLGVVVGVACATAVLVGALAVGDSVRLSLRDQALARIGRVDSALVAGDRYFPADLADRLAVELSGTGTAPVLQLRGVASVAGGAARTGIVDVFGVDDRFFALAPGAARPAPGSGAAYVNERLAAQLGVIAGDSVLVRVEKPSFLPRDTVLATVDDVSFALRVTVGAVLSEAEFGRFGLRASQVPPLDLFLSLPWLQEELELDGRANLLLLGGRGDDRAGDALVARADDALRSVFTLADAELVVRPVEGADLVELASDRVFIDGPVVEAVKRIEPEGLGVLTYFVNSLRAGARSTPYSMVSAIGPLSADAVPTDPAAAATWRLLPDGPGPNDLVVNQWLADDLQVGPGDAIDIDYFVMGPQLRLLQRSHAFRVGRVVPLEGAAADPSLMPPFPGLADSENCRDWEPGVPIELQKIRDVDEEYWDDHRGTPKAFLPLATGQALWANRFGNLTAVRGSAEFGERLAVELPKVLDPRDVGLFFSDIREPALAAGTSATDFGGLFLGLSFFLIVAALLLTALLFVFGVEQRAREIGVLKAIGLSASRVRRLFLSESLVLAVVGSAIGTVFGLGYTRAVLAGLGTLWRGAVGATTLTFHAETSTIVLGAVLGVGVAVGAMALVLRRAFERPAVELLASRGGVSGSAAGGRARPGWISLTLAIVGPLGAIALVATAGGSAQQAAGAFFGAGALVLIGALAGCRILLLRVAGTGRSVVASVLALGVRNAGRRPGRSLATIAMLASGTFLVVAVQTNRLEPPGDFAVRATGTGGFALYGRSTLPVLRDLGTAQGREAYGLEARGFEGVAFVPLRVRDGDDASCLNLSTPQNPRLLGVRPDALAERGAFEFASMLAPDGGTPTASPWSLLDRDFGDDVVPAIGDQASVTWSLHKAVGDTLDYVDERGRAFRVRIVGTVANSILQGDLVVSERHFEARYPSASGYRMFLIDAPAARVDAVRSNLTRALEDVGMELTPTTERLAAFNAVQNTYLLIFQALGGLGLLLGSVGLGMVVLRNALERRSELAVVSALGLSRGVVRRLVWSEHGLLLGLGLAAGVLAAVVAVIPGLRGGGLAWGATVGIVVAVGASGALWVGLATVLATRGGLLEALQEE